MEKCYSYNEYEMFIERVQEEWKEFIEELKTYTPEQIIEAAYTITYKEEIKNILLNDIQDYFTDENEYNQLYSMKNPIDELYEAWLHWDDTPFDMIVNSILDYLH